MQNQKSNIKDQKHKSKIKKKNIFNISYVFLIFTFLYLIFSNHANAQNIRYSITELGNCSSANECYLYCQIPTNTPACWSYGKYVMNPAADVLGETTVNLTYPISELGNCADANECFIYCNQPKNQSACYTYAKSHGLIKDDENATNDMPEEKMTEIVNAAKTELGCDGKESCMILCNNPDNYEKCRSFAVKHNLDRGGGPSAEEHRGPPPEVVENAKSELGCEGPQACSSFCNRPENGEKCFEFAKKHNLISKEERKHEEDYTEKKKEMLEEAKKELGCDSFESCAKFCGDPSNVEKCMTLGRRHGFSPPPPQQSVNLPQKPCSNEQECRAYCEKHPDECKGYTEKRSSFQQMNEKIPSQPLSGTPPTFNNQSRSSSKQSIEDNKKLTGQPELKAGEYLGPGGCKTEGECKAYCEKHPLDCPGFPKEKITPSQQFNTQSSTSNQNSPPHVPPNFRPGTPPPAGQSGSFNQVPNLNSSGKSNSSDYKPPEYKPEQTYSSPPPNP